MSLSVVVIAAGSGSRFKGSTPKHLVQVGPEKLLDRVHRLFLKNGIEKITTIIPPKDKRYKVLKNSRVKLVPRNGDLGTNTDKFIEAVKFCEKQSDLLIIYGDVFFTEDAVKTILRVSAERNQITTFCRFDLQATFGRPYGEIFAFWIPNEFKGKFLEAVLSVKGLFLSEKIWRDGGWEVCKYLNGVGIENKYRDHVPLPTYYEIDDLTDDIDFIEDLDNLYKFLPIEPIAVFDKLVKAYGVAHASGYVQLINEVAGVPKSD